MKGKCVTVILGAGLLVTLGGAAFASEAGGHGAAHALNWWDFFLRLLNFAILVSILVYLLKKPVSSFLSSRREGIASTLSELEQKKAEADKKAAEYKAKLAALDKETERIVAEYIQEGEVEKQKIIAAATRQAEYLKEQARLAIQQEMKAAKEALQSEVVDLSVVAAEEILRKNIKSDDQKRLVQEFMVKVGEAK